MRVERVAPGIKGRVDRLSNKPHIAGKITISTKKNIAAYESNGRIDELARFH